MRAKVHAKYGGRCAYCGEEITVKQMHIDHLKPIYRGNPTVNPKYKGEDTLENMVPACRACNLWKSVWTVEQFRAEIAAQVERLRLRSANFRMAERFGLVKEEPKPIVFYFEQVVVARPDISSPSQFEGLI